MGTSNVDFEPDIKAKGENSSLYIDVALGLLRTQALLDVSDDYLCFSLSTRDIVFESSERRINTDTD
ncbi:uncharacterized protein PHALS_03473 [Plasmopara halstedii]|uniref:Uncharacterized protein n=1 Tax=Plasmopara halstedii TaxID=4781 RepID=A0A0P1AZK7_PLAHL|nr:uncharacterized protein PHALS_03473 [Plasmopara halstedii]CEG46792.1 hypothetical protein PHALS_03473 [Plasmopara halstedii]|eukprot:XP_024583161.1 hypothetical protein PHALS_03473 [Plasmopara halstedii]